MYDLDHISFVYFSPFAVEPARELSYGSRINNLLLCNTVRICDINLFRHNETRR